MRALFLRGSQKLLQSKRHGSSFRTRYSLNTGHADLKKFPAPIRSCSFFGQQNRSFTMHTFSIAHIFAPENSRAAAQRVAQFFNQNSTLIVRIFDFEMQLQVNKHALLTESCDQQIPTIIINDQDNKNIEGFLNDHNTQKLIQSGNCIILNTPPEEAIAQAINDLTQPANEFSCKRIAPTFT